jgi:hypothetical protein
VMKRQDLFSNGEPETRWNGSNICSTHSRWRCEWDRARRASNNTRIRPRSRFDPCRRLRNRRCTQSPEPKSSGQTIPLVRLIQTLRTRESEELSYQRVQTFHLTLQAHDRVYGISTTERKRRKTSRRFTRGNITQARPADNHSAEPASGRIQLPRTNAGRDRSGQCQKDPAASENDRRDELS